MRKRLIAIIILLLALMLFTIGIVEAQYELIGPYYKEMRR